MSEPIPEPREHPDSGHDNDVADEDQDDESQLE